MNFRRLPLPAEKHDRGTGMTDKPLFERAYPFQGDVLALPVIDLDVASDRVFW